MEETRPDLDQLLTTQQAAELLGLHRFTLPGWRCAGRRELPWHVIGAGRIRDRVATYWTTSSAAAAAKVQCRRGSGRHQS